MWTDDRQHILPLEEFSYLVRPPIDYTIFIAHKRVLLYFLFEIIIILTTNTCIIHKNFEKHVYDHMKKYF